MGESMIALEIGKLVTRLLKNTLPEKLSNVISAEAKLNEPEKYELIMIMLSRS